MIKLLDRLIWVRGPIIYILFLSAGFGSVGKYPRAGWMLFACAFLFTAFWTFVHMKATPKEVKRLTVNDINGPDSLEEYMAQRRKLEHED